MGFKEVNQQISFPEEEEKILKFWQEHQTFQKSIDQRSNDKVYTFYDGPPFATGLPHYGHLLAGIIKDIIPRYQTMKGFRIDRRWGWDCHGLPVENLIEQDLSLKTKKDIQTYGIGKFNDACRASVLKYAEEWRKTVNRMGRWIDMENDYKTMDLNYMESVWWVFKSLHDKGLVYQGRKAMHICPRCETPLSNFEVTLGYKDVQDLSVIWKFRLTSQKNTFLLAWTTTPWSTLSTMGLSVNPDFTYLKVKVGDEFFIFAKERLDFVMGKIKDYEIIEELPGKKIIGLEYEPIMPAYKDIDDVKKNKNVYHTFSADYVKLDEGAGIVTINGSYGEIDMDAAQKNGLPIVMDVDMDGKFNSCAKEFAGQYVKDAEKPLIKSMSAQGLVWRHETYNHSYPHCWRCDFPLLNYATTAWFVAVTEIKERLLKNNQKVNWIPDHIQDGRFGKWLENARDWAVSRARYWGTPLPIWKNTEDDQDILVIGSISELEKQSGQKVADLHKHVVDDILIKKNDKIYKRIPDVFDCWFESGSMPYAQRHFPFEKGDDVKKQPSGFPANFIAEGLDQTRGWFYTLAILGTALFDKFPFQNVVVNGMVLAEDGKKMSKRLKNYPDPVDVLNNHGADALRLYMIQSPAVRADDLRFSEAGVKDIVRRILLKWWNSYSFFVSYAVIDKWQPDRRGEVALPEDNAGGETPPLQDSQNILDQWILSRLQSLLKTIEVEMKQYHLYNVVPGLLDFIEDLTNIYIRFNRKRFWQEENNQDKNGAYQTLYTVLRTFSEVMAPFTPFLAENIFQNLKAAKDAESVHLVDYPLPHQEIIDANLEKSVALMNRVILIVRTIREKKNIKVKIPLKRLSVIHRDQNLLNLLKNLENYLREELNVREIQYLTREDDFVELTAKANGASLGKKLGKKFGAVAGQITKLKSEQIVSLEQGKTLQIDGETIGKGDVLIYRNAKKGHENVVSDAFITVELDTTLDPDQIQEGLAREVVSRVQKLRKTADLKLDDRIHVEYQAECEIKEAIQKNIAYIQEQTLAVSFKFSEDPQGSASEVCEVEGKKLLISISVV